MWVCFFCSVFFLYYFFFFILFWVKYRKYNVVLKQKQEMKCYRKYDKYVAFVLQVLFSLWLSLLPACIPLEQYPCIFSCLLYLQSAMNPLCFTTVCILQRTWRRVWQRGPLTSSPGYNSSAVELTLQVKKDSMNTKSNRQLLHFAFIPSNFLRKEFQWVQ